MEKNQSLRTGFAVVVFCFLSSFIGLHAQDTLAHSLLWEVSGNRLENPSYVFGTVHLIPREKFFLPEGLANAVQKSERVFFELDVEKMDDLMTMLGMMNKLLMADGSSLRDLLDDADYALVKRYFEKQGLPLILFERVKPMFLTVLVSPEMNPFALKDGQLMSYELELSKMAKVNGKAIGGLETVEFQMSLFDSIPYAEQANMLVRTIQSEMTESSDTDQIYNAYVSQNLNALNELLCSEMDSKSLGMFVHQRNRNWIPIMKKHMARHTCFFAVGAGHLAGENGVLNLLKQEGFQLKPIRN